MLYGMIKLAVCEKSSDNYYLVTKNRPGNGKDHVASINIYFMAVVSGFLILDTIQPVWCFVNML